MKYLKMLGLAAFAAMAFTAFVGASTASATTIAKTGVKQAGSVGMQASIKAGTSAVLRDTFGFSANTCTTSIVEGSTEAPFSGTTVTGPIHTLSFENCTRDVTIHNEGTLHVEHTSGTNGRVSSSGAEVTVFSNIHNTYINCQTGAGTVLGTLTGVKHGNATMDINATLTCGPHLHSAKWTGTYTVTTADIGVES